MPHSSDTSALGFAVAASSSARRRPGNPSRSCSPHRSIHDESLATSADWSPVRRRERRTQPRVGRSPSNERSDLLGSRPTRYACDKCNCCRYGAYRYSSPVFSRVNGVPENVQMMDHANINAVLSRLSILPMEMKGYLHGTSLKEKLQTIRKTLRENGCFAHIESKETRHRKACYDHHRRSGAETARSSYEFLSHDPKKVVSCSPSSSLSFRSLPSQMLLHDLQGLESLRHNKWIGSSELPSQGKQSSEQQMGDLYLRRIADDCRKEFAFRILEKFVHSRLTHYMLLHITACAKGLVGDEKTKFLSLFKTEGAFKDKPLNEATYCELLSFVDKESKPAKDIVKALDASERSLQEEGDKEGYDIGDIREQMRTFMSLRKPTSPFVSSQVDDYESLFTTELLEDLLEMVDKQKLGDLQSLRKVIKLACFLALQGIDCSSSSV